MLEERNPERAIQGAVELDGLNKQRRALQEELFNEMVSNADGRGPFAYVGYFDMWPKGLSGILAARAVEAFGVPSFVLVKDKTTGLATGSGRSVAGLDLVAALRPVEHLLTRFGGHPQAAGVTLPPENVAAFALAFNRAAATRDMAETPIEAETILRLSQLTPQFLLDLARMEPLGIGNPAPIVEIRNATVASTGRGTVRISQGPDHIHAYQRRIDVPHGFQGTVLVEIGTRANALKALR